MGKWDEPDHGLTGESLCSHERALREKGGVLNEA